MTALVAAVRQALGTLFPVNCAVCGARDASVCEACRAALRASCAPRIRAFDNGRLPVAAAVTYDERMRALAAAYKERGRVDAVAALAPLLRASVLALARAHPGPTALLVPVPSRAAARVRRGFDHVELLIERALNTRAVPALRHTRRVADQAGLDRVARQQNLHGALVADARVAGQHCIVVDDFVTTGASLSEAARALRAQGALVLGAAVVAEAVRRNQP